MGPTRLPKQSTDLMARGGFARRGATLLTYHSCTGPCADDKLVSTVAEALKRDRWDEEANRFYSTRIR